MNNTLDPSHIMQTATAFWPSKVLLTAVELDLFSVLGEGAMTASELMETGEDLLRTSAGMPRLSMTYTTCQVYLHASRSSASR